MQSAQTPASKRCAGCAAIFNCGRDAPQGCWCAQLPPLRASSLVADAGCLCPACLGALCAQQSAAAAAQGCR